MEIDSGAYIYEDLMGKASFAKGSLDRRPNYFDLETAKDEYKDFLKEKVKCPTRAKLAMQKMYNREGIMYPEFFKENINTLEQSPEIDCLIKKVDKIESKQPKTLPLRNKLIESNKIKLDYVTPKMSYLEKLLFKIKFNLIK